MAVPLRAAALSRPSPWPVATAGVVWLLVGLSAAFWFWRVWGRSPVVPVPVAVAERAAVDVGTVARALGAGSPAQSAPVEAASASRLTLLGVVRDAQGRGAALISENGLAAKPYRVGASVPGGWVLRALEPRQASLGATDGSGGQLRLTLPVNAPSTPAPAANRPPAITPLTPPPPPVSPAGNMVPAQP